MNSKPASPEYKVNRIAAAGLLEGQFGGLFSYSELPEPQWGGVGGVRPKAASVASCLRRGPGVGRRA